MSSKYRWREKITVVTAENNTYSSAKVYHTIKLKDQSKRERYPLWSDFLKTMKYYKLILVNIYYNYSIKY